MFIEGFCRVPEGKWVGRPLKLDPFQRKFILDVYDNEVPTSLAILSIARKNGKTALIACLVLVHLVGPEAIQNSQIISGATSRDQAALVFRLARKMVELNPALNEIVHPVASKKQLLGIPMGTEYQAISAESTTAHGLSPIVAILDELGQVRGPTSDFVDAITTAQGAHDAPIIFVISTQAPTDADMLSIWIDDARTGADKSIICHVYEAEENSGVLDKDGWRSANPALGTFRSLKDVENQAQKAARMPSAESSFRNLTLNQRVAQQASLFSPSTWKRCDSPFNPDVFLERPVFAGLDLSARLDLTALALIAEDEDNTWHAKMTFWTPNATLRDRAQTDRAPYELWRDQGHLRALPGVSIDYSVLAKEIVEELGEKDIVQIAVDRWRLDQLTQEVSYLGLDLPLVPYGQGYKDMSPALDQIESVVYDEKLRHGGNPVLTFCVSNAVVIQDPAGNKKLDKSKASGRIDGIQALAMAFGIASTANQMVNIDTMIA